MREAGADRAAGPLESQLPEARFPGGVSTPAAVTAGLLTVLAVFCAVRFYVLPPPTSTTVLERSQDRLVGNLADTLSVSAQQVAADLYTALRIGDFAATDTPDTITARISEMSPRSRGVAVVDVATGTVVSSRGESSLVPAETLRGTQTTTIMPTLVAGKFTGFAVATPLTEHGHPGLVLISAAGSRLPEWPLHDKLDQSVLITDAAGQVADSRGWVPAADDRLRWDLIRRALGTVTADRPLTITGDGPGAAVPIVSASKVHTKTGDFGLYVVSVADAPVLDRAHSPAGALFAAGLVVVALIGLLLNHTLLLRPVRRVRRAALSTAAGGHDRLPWTVCSQTRWLTLVFSGVPTRRCRVGGVPAAAAPAVFLVLTLLWSGTLLIGAASTRTPVPTVVQTDMKAQVVRVAEIIGRSVADGLGDLRAVTKGLPAPTIAQLRTAVIELTDSQPRYRSVYVLNRTGAVLASAGRPAQRPEGTPPGHPGITQLNTEGRVPILIAHAPFPDGQVLIGEFDVNKLSRMLRRMDGHGRITDAGLRTIADPNGFLAFEQLPDGQMRARAARTIDGASRAGVSQDEDKVVAVSKINRNAVAATLEWVVVADRSLQEVPLPANEIRATAYFAVTVSAALAVLGFCWSMIVVVYPLNRLARMGRRTLAGERDVVFYPQRADEIGTIASCLELSRWYRAAGRRPSSTGRRPVGAATDLTVVIPRIRPTHPAVHR